MLRITFLLFLLICLVQTAQAFPQQTKSLDLVLSLEKQEYRAAEPLVVTGSLYNKENVVAKVLIINTTVFYRKLGQNFSVYHTNGDLYGGYKSTNFIELQPAEKISRAKTLLYDVQTKRFVLDEPGMYEIKVDMTVRQFGNERQVYTSNIEKVTVPEPLGKDKLALKALKRYQLGCFLNGLEPGIEYQEIEKTMEKAVSFLETYPHSFYTPLVLTMLKSNLEEVKKGYNEELPQEIESISNRVKLLIETNTIEDTP